MSNSKDTGANTASGNGPGVTLRIRKVGKHFGSRPVLDNIDLNIASGQFVAVVGRSGCGKSTLLRLLAGLEHADSGTIETDSKSMAHVVEDTRLVFQDSRLLPWKRVIDNVALGLCRHQRPQVMAALQAVGLEEWAHAWPATLSGGQKQRVALARALVHKPRLLLLDEPLGALDALTRIEMQTLVETLWQRHRFTVLLVTHDVSEAVVLADRVLLVENGTIGLDLSVDAARPRKHGDIQLALLETTILDRIFATSGHVRFATETVNLSSEAPLALDVSA